ncbi:hypothetical protein RE476_03645 [Methanolobus mangrovi]|uniref:Uncharacterized protein n=1 Tax=Methanolobus mangrovi TaxID=3072977 RepID=A0AA51UHE6_9EURY|nr:hypothetical protein [Methanolobus mangrovi]WMW22929.1 hypothetical protein RE476_03645 [Methanolobus mangrovi]
MSIQTIGGDNDNEHFYQIRRRKGLQNCRIPDYYHRFGFVSAKEYNIRTSWGDDLDAFMALEL